MLQKLAVAAFVRELNLENGDILEGQVEVKEIYAGSYLMRQDSHKVCSISFRLLTYWTRSSVTH